MPGARRRRRVLAAHQPNYLPWLGWLHKAGQADTFVLADDVQFTKHGFTNRNRIRTAEGWQWLTVPVRSRGRAGQPIRDVEVGDDPAWSRKHLNSLRWNYGHAPHFEEHAAFLDELYGDCHSHLVELNLRWIRYVLGQFAIDVEIRLSSELPARPERSQRIADLAVACGCEVYLAGEGGSREYLDEATLAEAGIEVRYTRFQHPRYPQCYPGFEAGMCCLDLLFNCGSRSREVLGT